MSNVNGLLNLLSTSSPDSAGLLGGNNPVTPKGPRNGENSFQDLLARLASQSGNNNNSDSATSSGSANQAQAGPGAAVTPIAPGQAEAVTAVSETTLAVTESIKVSNPQQLTQAEQALASLVVGLANVIQAMSQLNQGGAQQAQTALKALGVSPDALAGIQNLLANLQNFFQKLPENQNPLNLSSGQQTALLGQLFQQMIQNQQVLLGVPAATQGGTSNATTAGAGGNPTTAVLQVMFSETQADLFQQSGAQTSQVFIDLQTFKMSATFIQQGQGINLQPLTAGTQNPPNNLNQVLASANPASTPAVIQSAGLLAASQNDLAQNFKNLVQLLMQSGATQAVLTSFMRHQQAVQNSNALPGQTNDTSQALVNPLTQGNQPPQEIPPVNPADLTTGANNNPISNTTQTQAATNLPTNGVPAAENNVQPKPPNPNQGGVATNNLTPQASALPGNPAESPANTNVLPAANLEALNQEVDRLNAIAAQILTAGLTNNNKESQPAQNPGNAALAPANGGTQPPLAAATAVNSNNPAGAAPAQTTAITPEIQPPAPVPQPELNGLNPSQIAALNDTVARMNASVLHDIQGSIGGSNTAPDMNLTMGQAISSLTATRLTSAQPPTFGNPSVPINLPPDLIRQTPPANSAAPKTAGALLPAEPAQNTAAPNLIPVNTAQQTPVFSGPAINVSTAQLEPINQVTPNLQTAGNAPTNNQLTALNRIVGNTPPAGNNPLSLASLPAANTSNPAVTANPGTTPVVVPNTVVPLPQPATLPVGANPAAQANPANDVQAFAPAALNQTLNPPATSQAPVLPATAAVGEGIKAEIPATTVPRNENFANPSAVANTQPLSSVSPISPEAVAPTGTVLGAATGLGVLNVLDKNSPNNTAILEANTLLGLSVAANQTSGVHTTSSAALSAVPGMNFDSTSLISQISQQIAAQAAGPRAVSRLNFQLIPESLGRVTVQIALVDQSVSARIMVTNAEVRETLQAHMVDLKTALNQAGLQIDQLQVQVQGGGGSLLAQYFQYQQEGFGSRLPASVAPAPEVVQNPENTGDSPVAPSRMSLVDVLA